ncbi:hypothetical protein [Clostridium butyricum]
MSNKIFTEEEMEHLVLKIQSIYLKLNGKAMVQMLRTSILLVER